MRKLLKRLNKKAIIGLSLISAMMVGTVASAEGTLSSNINSHGIFYVYDENDASNSILIDPTDIQENRTAILELQGQVGGFDISVDDLQPETTEITTESETTYIRITSSETQPATYEFNPHVYSSTLSVEIPQDYWASFYNMCDALRAGETTFSCSSQEAYDFCMKDSTTANLFPAACLKISGESNDGTTPYENGVGRIYYKMPVEDFVVRQAEFENLITDILNSTLENDDTDFEKCLKLYLYIAENYDYEDDDGELTGECSFYQYFMTK